MYNLEYKWNINICINLEVRVHLMVHVRIESVSRDQIPIFFTE